MEVETIPAVKKMVTILITVSETAVNGKGTFGFLVFHFHTSLTECSAIPVLMCFLLFNTFSINAFFMA